MKNKGMFSIIMGLVLVCAVLSSFLIATSCSTTNKNKSIQVFEEKEASHRLYLSTLDALVKIGKMDTVLGTVFNSSKDVLAEELKLKTKMLEEDLKMKKIINCKELTFGKKPLDRESKQYTMFMDCLQGKFEVR